MENNKSHHSSETACLTKKEENSSSTPEKLTKTVSFDELRDNLAISKKKKKKVNLKSVENIDLISTNKSVTNNKLSSKSTSLASVNSSKSFKFSYSYVVLLASFFAYMLASLLSSCFGVFFESMSTDLGWSHSRVAFVGSLLTALQDLAGPISSALTNHYGCRKTAIFGGLICALGIIGSAYASEFWLLGFLMGGVSGFGASLVLVSSVVVVTYYFEDKPSLAAGLTISGASFGQSIFTMIIIKLNEVYGRSGCFLILGGILLNIVVCGALFRPLKWELEDEEDEDEEDDDEEDDEDDEDEEDTDCSDEDEDESSKDDEAKKSKPIKKSNTRESNLSEITKSDKNAVEAPIASQEKILMSEEHYTNPECLNLFFHDFNNHDNIYIMDNKDENQVFYLENEAAFVDQNNNRNSSQYLSHRSRKDFSSDPCLNNKSEQIQMPSIGVSLISLNSNFIRENELKQVENFHKNQNFSYFDKHHSLQIIPSNSVTFKHKQQAKSELILKNYSAYSLAAKKDDNDHEQELRLDNAEFVLLDAEEMITNCDSNLMLSASQTAIYLPFLENNQLIDEVAQAKKSKSNLNDECQSIKSFKTDKTNHFSQRNSSNILSSTELKHDVESTSLNQNNLTNAQNTLKPDRPLSTFSNFLNKFSSFFTSKKTINQNNTNLKLNAKITPTESQSSRPVTTNTHTNQTTNQLIGQHANKNHILRIDPVNSKLIINSSQSNKAGHRFIIARCNCRQRNLQNLQRRNNKQRRSKLRSYSVNITTDQDAKLIPQKQEEQTHTEAAQSHSNIVKDPKQLDHKTQFKFRHFPNCPISNLKRLKNLQSVNHNQIQSNVAGNQNKRNNFFYVPSLFQNSYRFPLHFKNVYYYKSLINLNMRLKNLKNHSNHPATLAGVFDFNKEGANNQHHSNHVHNNVSLSCPNLNPKQFFIMNKNVINFRKLNEQYGGQVVPLKAIKRPMQILTTSDLKELIHKPNNSAKHLNLNFTPNLAETSKVLNAGSILLTTSRDLNFKNKKQTQEKPLVIKLIPLSQVNKTDLDNTNLDINLSLTDFDDKIADAVLIKKKLIPKIIDSKDEDDDEEDDEDDEEEDDSDDDDSEDEDTCDNCFTRTKAGNYMYKTIWKPLINSIKFIFYSICENLKLFRYFRFCVFAFCNFVLSFFYEAPFVFINSYMMKNQLSESQAGTVTVAVGIVCIFSSIAYGYIGDSKKINSIILYSASLVLCGLCCCAIPFFITNYLVTMTLMVLLGALISVSDVLVPIICVNLVGYDDFVNAYGLMFFCQGLASLSGPPLLAIIVDYSGDYALSYYIIGVGIILSGLILSSVLCYNQYVKQKPITPSDKNNRKQSVEKV